MGYAFVDLSTATEAQRAITELSGKEILSRKVSVQLARKPETPAEKSAEAVTTGAEDEPRKRNAGRGRGRGRGRGGRGARGGRVSTPASELRAEANQMQAEGEGETREVLPLTDTTAAANNESNIVEGAAVSGDKAAKEKPVREPREPREPRQPRQRGPPEDGVPSKNKVMVANLPYDLSEEKVGPPILAFSVQC